MTSRWGSCEQLHPPGRQRLWVMVLCSLGLTLVESFWLNICWAMWLFQTIFFIKYCPLGTGGIRLYLHSEVFFQSVCYDEFHLLNLLSVWAHITLLLQAHTACVGMPRVARFFRFWELELLKLSTINFSQLTLNIWISWLRSRYWNWSEVIMDFVRHAKFIKSKSLVDAESLSSGIRYFAKWKDTCEHLWSFHSGPF